MLNKFLSLIFPTACIRCRRIAKHGFLCTECKEEYEKELSDGCLSCGNPHAKCRCDSKYLDNEKLIYAIPYRSDGVSRELLLKMKTSNNKALVSHLADKMASALKENGIEEDVLITYVPRSPTKIRLEGVDQAKILAYALAEKMKLDIENVFICRGGVKEQKSLEYGERDIYARTRFSLRLGAEEKIKGKRVVLVDDIITSGATVKVCSEILTEFGAEDVICLGAGRSVKY
ncbi:MAG: ComF family protein [Clostridia bacterium]|nr:ComF family protein [Clostridia bacterium]